MSYKDDRKRTRQVQFEIESAQERDREQAFRESVVGYIEFDLSNRKLSEVLADIVIDPISYRAKAQL